MAPGLSPDHGRAGASGTGAARAVADRMATAASAWLDSLDDEQAGVARWGGPASDEAVEAERLRWYYTPTDHGGLPIGAMRPAQQSRAMQLVASGLSLGGYVTVSTIMGLENVLDRVEGWDVDWGRERGRDPGLYHLRVFGEPGGAQPWGWRFGGHHISLNYLVVAGEVRSTTPCFLGADPATSPLLTTGSVLRPLGGAEDLARELIRSLTPDLAERAVLLGRAPSDIIGGNRSRVADGDEMLRLPDLWRGEFSEHRLVERVSAMDTRAESGSGYDSSDHAALALTTPPRGLPAADLDHAQREVLRALLASYLGRVPEGLAPGPTDDAALAAVHLAWAGGTGPDEPHYYRLQGPGLLVEYDNTQRAVNHAHSVWRVPESDFGGDVLAAHRFDQHRARA